MKRKGETWGAAGNGGIIARSKLYRFMLELPMTTPNPQPFEVHDPQALAQARAILDACQDARDMQESVIAAVRRNETWRGQQCINLLAPEAPTSPAVRVLLASEIGTRAAEGHIGPVNRWFAGTRHIDEVEALCVELLKRAFRCRYADHRPACAGRKSSTCRWTRWSQRWTSTCFGAWRRWCVPR